MTTISGHMYEAPGQSQASEYRGLNTTLRDEQNTVNEFANVAMERTDECQGEYELV